MRWIRRRTDRKIAAEDRRRIDAQLARQRQLADELTRPKP